jgi:hypothetical protein
MDDNVLYRHAHRCNRNVLFVYLGVLLIPSVTLWFSWRYIYNCIAGPGTISPATLASLVEPHQILRYFITIDGVPITGDKEIDMVRSLRRHVTGSSDAPSGEDWLILAAPPRFFVVRTPAGKTTGPFEGGLEEIPSKARYEFDQQYLAYGLDFKDLFLPVMLNAAGFRRHLWWLLLLILPAAVVGLGGVWRVFLRERDWHRSPIFKQIARFGVPAEATLAALENEMRQYPVNSDLLRTYLSPTFLLRDTLLDFTVMRVSDMVCIDTRGMREETAGRKFEAITVFDRHGVKVKCEGERVGLERFIAAVNRLAPWVTTTRQDAERIKKEFAALVAEAERRRAGAGPQETTT